jgi:hypothetical protein
LTWQSGLGGAEFLGSRGAERPLVDEKQHEIVGVVDSYDKCVALTPDDGEGAREIERRAGKFDCLPWKLLRVGVVTGWCGE